MEMGGQKLEGTGSSDQQDKNRCHLKLDGAVGKECDDFSQIT